MSDVAGECCRTCKSFSRTGAKKGFCLRLKKSTYKSSVCGYYRPDVVIEYEMECRLSRD